MTTHNPTGTVPATDSAANVTGLDVLGSKLDTAAGDSLAARMVVPPTDSADNDYISDVLGSKLDRSYNGGNSLYGELHTLAEHAHSQSYVLPDRAAAIQATAGNGWAYGVESATLGTPAAGFFDVHWAEILSGTNAEYQGALLVDGVVVTEFTWLRVTNQVRSFSKRVQMVPIAAGAITIRLASSVNGATATFKVEWHPY